MAIKTRAYSLVAGRTQRLEITQGEDCQFVFKFAQPDDGASPGAAVDFSTFASAFLTVRDPFGIEIVARKAALSGAGTADDPYKLTAVFGGADTVDESAQVDLYDLRWVDADDHVEVLIKASPFVINLAQGRPGDLTSGESPPIKPYGLRWRDDVSSGAWDAGTQYQPNDAVSHVVDGQMGVYRARIQSTGHEPGAATDSYWQLLVRASPGVNWRDDVLSGSWDAGTQYQTLDGVRTADGSWRAVAPSLGVQPGTDASKWRLIAAKGADGAGGSGGTVPVPADPTDDGKILFALAGGYVLRFAVASDIRPDFAIASFAVAPATAVVGDDIVSPTFTASYVGGTPTSAKIQDGANPDVVLSSPFTSGTEPHTYVLPDISSPKTFTLRVVGPDGVTVYTRTASIAPALIRVWGVASIPGSYDGAFIASLIAGPQSFDYATNGVKAKTIDFDAPVGAQYGFYCIPSSYGLLTHFTDPSTGFNIPTSRVASSVSFDLGNGAFELMDIYRVDFVQTGAFSEAFS